MSRWKEVIVHHSAGIDTDELEADDIRRFHVTTNGWRDIGYHFVVEKVDDEYVAVTGRPLNVAGAHCPGHNNTAIGVCLVGDFTDEPPPDDQLYCAARLVAGLCGAFGIDATAVHFHREFKATECPGKSFPTAKFIANVLAHL